MDTNVFDAVFWSFFLTTLAGLILKLASMMYKSKCKEVSCCCIKIIRDVDIEEKEQEFINHQPTNSNSNSNLEESKV